MNNKFIYNESINEIIKRRKSVRTYKTDEVSNEIIEKLNKYIEKLNGVFNKSVIFKILDSNEHINGARLGTYGVIKGANKFIAVKINNDDESLIELGYKMEELILYATSLGLGSCWIGGTFKKGQFAKAMEVNQEEILPIISPIGYESENKSFLEKTMKKVSHCNYRKPWNEIFFFRGFTCPLTEHTTLDEFKDVLENVRLAPSALNKQPWRIVKQGENFHFFISNDKEEEKNLYNIKNIDIGIAMCHFDLTCKEKGIKGKFKIVNPHISQIPKHYKYIITWIKE